MSKKWIIAIVVVGLIVVVGGGWWYFSHENTPVSTSSENQNGPAESSENSIVSFDFNGLTPVVHGVVDVSGHTISLVVPEGTDVTKIAPTITVSDNATVIPNSGVEQDFTNPVVYMVIAQDNSVQNYTVTVIPETSSQGS